MKWLAIDASAITAVDFTAGKELKDLRQDLAKQNVELALTRVSDSLRRDLNRLDLIRIFGESRIFDSRHECVEAYRRATGFTPQHNSV